MSLPNSSVTLQNLWEPPSNPPFQGLRGRWNPLAVFLWLLHTVVFEQKPQASLEPPLPSSDSGYVPTSCVQPPHNSRVVGCW